MYKINNEDINSIVGKMTLEEKAGLCSGESFWHLKSIERLNIPSIAVSDGPHGLRKQAGGEDHLGINKSVEAICFPTACATASSFDRELLGKMGEALGEECLAENVAVLLGPGANIKRSPLCGRNFEYFSEDPYLSGELATSIINGMQSKNVGASLKHFAANSQEKARLICDSVIDERTLREIYLQGFETAVKNAKPWTVMCSYNKVNGVFASESQKLLTNVLRDEWGFKGLVVSDWGAVNDRVEGIRTGLDLEMPGIFGMSDAKIVDAVNDGSLNEETLNNTVLRILEVIAKHLENNKKYSYDKDKHNNLARQIACESAVLLKNDGVLPIDSKAKVAVVGEFAKTPRFQGGGSSKINPYKTMPALDEFVLQNVDVEFAKGYSLLNDEINDDYIKSAIDTAKDKDVVVIYAGLPNSYESEGYDRAHIDLPPSHNKLIFELAMAHKNVVVVLNAGGVVSMPWLNEVKAVISMGLAGQAGGAASVDLLLGKISPSGKLTETYPLKINDNPSFKYFGDAKSVEYRESIYVGYRYYDKANVAVLFPFGFGLSYSKFEYADLVIDKNSIASGEDVKVEVKVKNIGNFDAKEIVQLYVAPPKSRIFKAVKELKGFCKVLLKAGEEKVVKFTLPSRAFAYYNVNINDWHVESGTYEILVGQNAEKILLKGEVQIESNQDGVVVPDYSAISPCYYNLNKSTLDIPKEQFEAIYGAKMPHKMVLKGTLYHDNSTIGDIKHTFVGKIILNAILNQAKSITDDSEDTKSMFEAMVMDMPLRSFVSFGGGAINFTMLNGMVLMLNKKFFKGLSTLVRGLKESKKTRK